MARAQGSLFSPETTQPHNQEHKQHDSHADARDAQPKRGSAFRSCFPQNQPAARAEQQSKNQYVHVYPRSYLCAGDERDFDAAFEHLRRHLEDIKPYLLESMTLAAQPRVKGALLELMGNTKDPQFVPHVAAQLESPNGEVRFWAFVALQQIGTPMALRIAGDVNIKTLRRRPK